MKVKLIGNIFYWVFVSLLGALTLLILAPLLPIPGNYKLLTVLSGSMAPAMKVGSLVIVAPAKDYKIGDVITFNAGGQIKATVTHRVNEIKTVNGQTVYITKGDANNATDNESVYQQNVIGKVRFDIPGFGYLIAGARKPLGFAAIVLIPASVIVIDEIKKIVVELKKPKMFSKKDE